MVSTITMPRRITDCGTFGAIREPRTVPGTEPTISGSSSPRSRPCAAMFASAAASTSGIACTRSVPTSFTADRPGYSISSATMITEPDPTEVTPTSSPPDRADQQGGQRTDRRVLLARRQAAPDQPQTDVEAQA